MAIRASRSFYAVAAGKKVGDDLLKTIKKAKGRNGSPITSTTVRRWGHEGLVKVVFRKPTKKDHHRAKPIEAVKLTRAGAALIKHADSWR